MEVGAQYSKKRLYGKKYFNTLLERVEDVPKSVKELLKLSVADYNSSSTNWLSNPDMITT
jgi:hypothetical protein